MDIELFVQKENGDLLPITKLHGADEHFTIFINEGTEWCVCETKFVIARHKISKEFKPLKRIIGRVDVTVYNGEEIIFKDPTFNKSGVEFFKRNKRVANTMADSTLYFKEVLHTITWN